VANVNLSHAADAATSSQEFFCSDNTSHSKHECIASLKASRNLSDTLKDEAGTLSAGCASTVLAAGGATGAAAAAVHALRLRRSQQRRRRGGQRLQALNEIGNDLNVTLRFDSRAPSMLSCRVCQWRVRQTSPAPHPSCAALTASIAGVDTPRTIASSIVSHRCATFRLSALHKTHFKLLGASCASGRPPISAGERARDDIQHREPRPISTPHSHLQQLLHTGHSVNQDGVHRAVGSAHDGIADAHEEHVAEFRHEQDSGQQQCMGKGIKASTEGW
jgi:hypothetical protein